MKTNCVTHHYACDCREEIFKETQGKLKLALEIIEILKKSNDSYADAESWMVKDKHSWRKSSPRSHGDDELIRGYHHLLRDWIGSVQVGGKLARQTQKEVNEMLTRLK